MADDFTEITDNFFAENHQICILDVIPKKLSLSKNMNMYYLL